MPPDPKDDKALKSALDLIRGVTTNSAFPPSAKRAENNLGAIADRRGAPKGRPVAFPALKSPPSRFSVNEELTIAHLPCL